MSRSSTSSAADDGIRPFASPSGVSRPARNCSNWRPISSPVGIGSSSASRLLPSCSARANASYCCSSAWTTSATSVLPARYVVTSSSRSRAASRRSVRSTATIAGALDVLEQRHRRLRGSRAGRGSAGCAPRSPSRRATTPASRSSSRAWALDGMRSSPRHGLSPDEQVGVVGVVGDRDRPGVRHRHRHGAHPDHAADAEALDDLPDRDRRRPPSGCRARDRAAAGTACRWRRRAGAPPAGARRTARSGRGRTTSPAGGPGSRGTRRPRRSRRRDRPRTARPGAGPRSPRRCRRRGTRRGRAPSRARSTPSSSGTSSTMWTRRSGSGTGTSRLRGYQRVALPRAQPIPSPRRRAASRCTVPRQSRAPISSPGPKPASTSSASYSAFGALAGAEHHEHVEVDEGQVACLVWPSVRGRRAAARRPPARALGSMALRIVPQDPPAVVVVPVVQDVGEEVDVGTRRAPTRRSRVPTPCARSLRPALGEGGVGLGGHVGAVGDHAGQARPGLEYAGQHRAAPAADVDDGLGLARGRSRPRSPRPGPSARRAMDRLNSTSCSGWALRCSQWSAPLTRS